MPSGDVEISLGLAADLLGSALLALPEDQWFDRKSVRISQKKLADALIGMANADGGVIVVGLCDGQVEGTDVDPARRNELMQAAIQLTVPPVRAPSRLLDCVRSDGYRDHLLIFEIETSETVHATTREEVFLRVGDETRKLGFTQRQELLYDKGQVIYEGQVLAGADPDALDLELLDNYARRVGHPDPRRLLAARGLTRDGNLTIAGYLLFGLAPQDLLPSALLRVSRFSGTERGLGARQRLQSDFRIEAPLPRMLVEARKIIGEVQPTRRALSRGGLFEDIPLVPEDAWLEGVVNAVVHRSYSLAGDHIHVDVFDDRIEIESPGRFPGLVDLSDPSSATRFARNPRIARVCADLRFGQELGEGIRRMFEEMRLARLNDPIYRQTAGSVRLTLSGEPVDRALHARLPEETRVVITALRETGRLSTGELADIMDLSRPSAIRRLSQLRDEGVIEWVGKSARDPRAYWRLPR
jgi:ATP-dependent DNA helicase RecG